jgi:Ecdysteroid kinase-like family
MKGMTYMTDHVFTDIHQLTANWFTTILMSKGALLTGGVSDFEAQHSESTNAHLVKIHLRYQAGSTGTLPPALLLKICADGTDLFGPSEVNYYTRDYISLHHAPIPRCYDAHYSMEQRRYHILMDDHSATHRNNWNTLPTHAYGSAVAGAVAALHAHWWGEQRLGSGGMSIPGSIEIERYLLHIQPGLLPMLESATGEIDPSWASVLLDIFDRHPAKMVARTKQRNGFTLVHGDLNPGNILSPLAGDSPTYLIDRQPFEWSLTTWLGVSDISYMMVHCWKTDLRRKWEFPVLRQYHESLMANGVTGYSWEQLVRDYQLCAIQSIYVATAWCVVEADRISMKWVWLPQLKRSMAAFFDLHCDELWA